ncbi:MAG: helix-turn-helix transcriptional regulator [Polyangiaceae bacterium]|nr:helix-turn-helix transcriptional regulator [Myxococcales bacterium]MCB9589450.1 helix-turn-helix transcriptional regulator [Polyangiaceae bacterium]
MKQDDSAARKSSVFAARWRWQCTIPNSELVTHDHAVLGLKLSGRAKVEQQSEWNLEPGEVLLVPAGQPHRTLEAIDSELYGVGFCVSCFVDENNASLLEPFQRVRSGGSPIVRLPAERQAHYELLCRELERVSSRIDAGATAAQRSLLTLILDEVAQAASAAEPLPESLTAQCLRLIEQRCLGPFTLLELAEQVRRTPTHITTLLRKQTGRSAHQWIVLGRMAEARRRLLHSDEMVEVIAERVGYSDPTSFIRMFRRHHSGQTPNAWRASRNTLG